MCMNPVMCKWHLTFFLTIKGSRFCEKISSQPAIPRKGVNPIMSSDKAMTESHLRTENVQELLKIEDQIRVDDDMLAAELPDRRSSRNRAVYNPTSKASLPGRLTSRNRTVFMKDVSSLPPRRSNTCMTEMRDSQQSKDLRRTKTVG